MYFILVLLFHSIILFPLQTEKGFIEAYHEALVEFKESPLYGGDDQPHHYATFAYDGVWTVAQALDRVDAELK